MSDQLPPHDATPVSPLTYWRESFFAWQEFNQRTGSLFVAQAKRLATRPDPDSEIAETVTAEMLRTVSDLNLRQWQNLARLLDSVPDWMQAPHVLDIGALTDWFDRRRRDFTAGFDLMPTSQDITEDNPVESLPETLTAPSGTPDDLTRIKGIGPKLSDKLNTLGIYQLRQIASWTAEEADWFDAELNGKGRIAREDWISQAKHLTANGAATVH